MSIKQPELVNSWGWPFYGEAKTITGDLWWHEVTQDDGTIKRVPLMPKEVTPEKDKP